METSSKLHRDTSGAGMSNVLYFVRTVAAFVVGLFVAFVLVVGVEIACTWGARLGARNQKS